MKKYFVGIKGGRFETFEADKYEKDEHFVNFTRDGEVVGSVSWFSIDYVKLLSEEEKESCYKSISEI